MSAPKSGAIIKQIVGEAKMAQQGEEDAIMARTLQALHPDRQLQERELNIGGNRRRQNAKNKSTCRHRKRQKPRERQSVRKRSDAEKKPAHEEVRQREEAVVQREEV